MVATTMMTLYDPHWTHAETANDFADQEEWGVAVDAADTVEAWLVNEIHNYLPGWTYHDGTFTGPYVSNAYDVIVEMVNEAGDYAISCLEEIREEHAG